MKADEELKTGQRRRQGGESVNISADRSAGLLDRMFGLDDQGHPGVCRHAQPPPRVACVLSEG